MRVLWLCNIVLPELCKVFGFCQKNVGGWLTGMWEELKKYPEINLGICNPIVDRERMRDGTADGISYYSFPMTVKEEALPEQIDTFQNILKKFRPDVIHIWGTEYQHSFAMIKACEITGSLSKTVVNIQGLVSVCAKHYCFGLPEYICQEQEADGKSIALEQKDFAERGAYEAEVLKKAGCVIGRTDWDRACVKQIAPDTPYYHCGEILREAFYEKAGSWKFESCEKHSIFISQGNYPVKGLHLILRELRKLREQYADIHVSISGNDISRQESAYGRYIKKCIEDNSLGDSITFLGMLTEKEMRRQYLRANVFLSASTIENSSNSVCEAMLLGVPVVSSMVGGLSSLIQHNVSGLFYPLEESYMMPYYVDKLFADRELCEKISKNASKETAAIVDKRNNMMRTVELYRKICQENS